MEEKTTNERKNTEVLCFDDVKALRISLHDSLLNLKAGQAVVIRHTEFPFVKVIRSVAYLRGKGYKFSCSVAGRIDETLVTRLK